MNAAARPRSAQPARDDDVDSCSFMTSSFVRSSRMRVTLGRAWRGCIGRGARSCSASATILRRRNQPAR